MGLVGNDDPKPLILTLKIDDESQHWLDGLRVRYFPPDLNYLRAHVTLFHHLPGVEREPITGRLRSAASAEACFPVEISGLRSLGRGVALSLASPALLRFHAELATEWHGWLTAQDRQAFKPHVTIQNKVTPEEARTTLALLQAEFQIRRMLGVGLELWRYEGGPWHHLQTFPFGN